MIRYLNIPLEWLQVLSPAEAVVLAYIDLRQRKYGSYTGTLKELAETCGYGDVRPIVYKLCSEGFLTKQQVLRERDKRNILLLTCSYESVNTTTRKRKYNNAKAQIQQRGGANTTTQKRKHNIEEAQIQHREGVNTTTIPFSKINITNKGGEISAPARATSLSEKTEKREIVFEEWQKFVSVNTGQTVQADSSDLATAAALAEKLDTLIGGKPPEELRGAAAYLMQHGYECADQWQRTHWSLQVINAQFPQIINQISNPNPTRNGKQQPNTAAADSIVLRGAEELQRAIDSGLL